MFVVSGYRAFQVSGFFFWVSGTCYGFRVICFMFHFSKGLQKRRRRELNPDLSIARNHSCPLYHSGIAARPLITSPFHFLCSMFLVSRYRPFQVSGFFFWVSELCYGFHVICFRLQAISGFRFLFWVSEQCYGFRVLCFMFHFCEDKVKSRWRESNPDLSAARNHSYPWHHSGVAAGPFIF